MTWTILATAYVVIAAVVAVVVSWFLYDLSRVDSQRPDLGDLLASMGIGVLIGAGWPLVLLACLIEFIQEQMRG